MDMPELNFERLECLDDTWFPMMAGGEDHFVGTVSYCVYPWSIWLHDSGLEDHSFSCPASTLHIRTHRDH